MRNFIDGLALRWLKRRGYFLVEPWFVGVVLGHSYAVEDSPNPGDIYKRFDVQMPARGQIIALNHSKVDLA